jgi:hypothetical protein
MTRYPNVCETDRNAKRRSEIRQRYRDGNAAILTGHALAASLLFADSHSRAEASKDGPPKGFPPTGDRDQFGRVPGMARR